MGSGKSTVGRLLAIRAGLRFVDLDQAISERVGMAIPTIFERYGEGGFRKLEAAVLGSLGQGPMVVATGGGIVDTRANIRRMRRLGKVCFLETSLEEVRKRLGNEQPGRPLWKDGEELARRYASRANLYEKAAHWTLNTDGIDPNEIVLQIVENLEKRGR